MDHERVLSVFLHVIDYFIQWISATEHCPLLVELGFQQPSFSKQIRVKISLKKFMLNSVQML